MPDKSEQNSKSGNPHWFWGVIIAAWTAVVFILFFVNLIGNYLSGH